MTTLRRDFARLFCAGLITFIIVGFLGHWFASGDSLAVFRIEAAVLLFPAAALAYALGARRTPVISILVALLTLGTVLPFWGEGPAVPQPDFTLHQHNMLFSNPEREKFVDHITQGDADVVLAQEIGFHNAIALQRVQKEFPHYHFCRYMRGGVGVLVRNIGPRLASGCAEQTELAWVQIDTSKGPVTFASVHLRWPWPNPQFWQVALVEEEIAKLPRPLVVGGDFNMVPWAASVERIAAAAGGEVGQGLMPTFQLGPVWPAFRIDNVIAPMGSEMNVTVIERLGSDHKGLIAKITLPERQE